MRTRYMYGILTLLLLAAPLSAQLPETIRLERPVVNFAPNILPAPVDVIVQGMSNEDVVAALDRQRAAFIAAQEQPTQSTIERIGTKAAYIGLGLLILWRLEKLINKKHDPHPAHAPHPDALPHPPHPDAESHPTHPDHPDDPTHPTHPDPDPHPDHPDPLPHPVHPTEDPDQLDRDKHGEGGG